MPTSPLLNNPLFIKNTYLITTGGDMSTLLYLFSDYQLSLCHVGVFLDYADIVPALSWTMLTLCLRCPGLC